MISEVFRRELKSFFGNRASDHPAHLRAYSRDVWPLLLLRIQGGEKLPRPWMVLWPRTVEEVVTIVEKCKKEGVPLVPYGGGSGVCGGAVMEEGGVVMDTKLLDRVRAIDEESMLIEVEAGKNGERFERLLQRKGYTLGHFPSSIYCSTVGGWIATRSAGQLSTLYGKIEDMVEAIEVVLPDGRVISTKKKPRSASGPDFNQLFVGSEGSFGIITSATLRINKNPSHRRFRGIKFKNVEDGIESIKNILQSGIKPSGVRLYDELDTLFVASELKGEGKEKKESFFKSLMMRAQRLALSYPSITRGILNIAPGECLLILAFDGSEEKTKEELNRALLICEEHEGKDLGEKPGIIWWRDRYKVSYNMSPIFYGGSFVDTIEVSAPWSKLNNLYQEIRKAISQDAICLAHFSHAYTDGCSIYFTFAGSSSKKEEKIKKYRNIWASAMDACISSGGSISHHHGVGRLKSRWLKNELGDAYELLLNFKKHIDPANIMNPGVMGIP